MSKLIESLESVGTVTPNQIGFGTSRSYEKNPPLLLVALYGAKAASAEAQYKADSYIIATEKVTKSDLKSAKTLAKSTPWGFWPNDLTSYSLDDIKNQGGDFFIFSTLNTPAEILATEDLGRLITVPVEFPEELGNSLEGIPVDAVIIVGLEESSPLSIKELMQIRSVRDLISKPLMLLRSQPLSRGELTVIQEVGIQGIVLDLRTMRMQDANQVREAINELPTRRNKRDKPDALLPKLTHNMASLQMEEEEEEEEE